MVKCPKCATELNIPLKTWSMSRKLSGYTGKETLIGMFECTSCGNKFRAGVKARAEIKAKVEEGEVIEKGVNIKSMAEKIKGIEVGLVNTLKNLRDKLKTLEAERANLLLEIEELKKMAEGRANAMESEINMLKEEVKSLKQLLGVSENDSSDLDNH